MAAMSKRERLEAIFAGEAADRPAVALWRHWPGDDQRAEDLARAHVAFQQRYDFDFVKVTPSSSYCLEDWGATDRYLGSLEGTREYTHYPIAEADDWLRLPVLDPGIGALGRQLRCLRAIREGLGAEVPCIQTIFNPLSQMKNLVGADRLLVQMRSEPEAFRRGLETITETTVGFVSAVIETGASGIFLATQHASFALMSEEEYGKFGRPYDLRILEAAAEGWLNLLHIHGDDIMFDAVADYPVQVVNWHDRETPPSLREALDLFPGAVCGGLRQWETMVRAEPDDVHAEARDAVAQTGGRRFILGTGCVTPIVAPTSNIRAAREAVGE
jgi:uroporphyrinogen decarboxylase